MEKRATQRGRESMNLIKDDFKVYTVRDGLNKIRILPPTWEDADHCGFDGWVNYQIGANKDRAWSLSKMLGKKDPIAEEQKRADREGDDDYAKSLEPKRRVVYYIIDRKAEEEGVQVYIAPWTLDRDICAQAADDDSGEALAFDHPDEGYDITFTRSGKGLNTEYTGVKLARSSSPISKRSRTQDEILEQVTETPLPEVFEYQDYKTLEALFEGARSSSRDDDQDDDQDDDDALGRGEDLEIEDLEKGMDVIMTMENGDEFEGVLTIVRDTYVKIDLGDGDIERVKVSDIESVALLEEEEDDQDDPDEEEEEEEDPDEEEEEEEEELRRSARRGRSRSPKPRKPSRRR